MALYYRQSTSGDWLLTAATAGAGLLAGTLLFKHCIDIPSQRDVAKNDERAALHNYRTMQPRAMKFNPPLAILSSGMACGAWYLLGAKREAWPVLAGGLALGSIVPYYFAAMKSIDDKLLDKTTQPPDSTQLLEQRALRSTVNTVLAIGGFAALLVYPRVREL